MHVTALKEFLTLLKSHNESDNAISEYFRCGGNCLELLQIWELDTTCPPTLIVEIVQHLIVAVIEKHPDMQMPTLEACRYLLNTHLTLINKMLQLASTPKERFLTLKLLTIMVAFSPFLVKDILLNVKFQLSLLIKHMDDISKSTRVAFINFLMSFFVDGHYPTILQLLHKKFLFASIMPGLKYDPYETVKMVLMMLKTHVLENAHVSKPIRVKIFSNVVIKGLTYLYDWRGPNCMEEKRQRPILDGNINKNHRAEIAELTHEILLVLCTSIKHGVIFRDELFGTGKQHRNPLMFNIIEVAFRGEHFSQLQQELVVKMAAECPDLVTTIWNKIAESLEPRPSINWMRAMRFMRQLVTEIKSHGIVQLAKQLRPLVFAQVIQFLVMPTHVLDQLGLPHFEYDSNDVKQEVAAGIVDILKAVHGFMQKTKEFLPENYSRTLKSIIEDHLQRHMPSVEFLLENWLAIPKEAPDNAHKLPKYDRLVYMTAVVNILDLYHDLCPDLLCNLKFSNVDELLQLEFEESASEHGNKHQFRVCLIKLLTQLDPGLFLVSGEIFPLSMGILADSLRMQDDDDTRLCISNILTITGLFIDCDYEIAIWTEALKQKHFPKFFSSLLALPHENVTVACETSSTSDSDLDILQRLSNDACTFTTYGKPMKSIAYSGVIATALQEKVSKKLRPVLGTIAVQIFHLQTDIRSFQKLVETHPGNLPETVREYIASWPESSLEVPELIETTNIDLLCILDTSTALFRLVNHKNTKAELVELIETTKKHASKMLAMVYRHPKVLENFQISQKNTTFNGDNVQFLTEITEHIQNVEKLDISDHLKTYQRWLYKSVLVIISQKISMSKSDVETYMRLMNTFGLTFDGCVDILNLFVSQSELQLLDAERKPNLLYTTLVAVLHNYSNQIKDVASEYRKFDNTKSLFRILAELNRHNTDCFELAATMHSYLTLQPDQITAENTREYFVSVVQREEYCKENALLALMIFKQGQKDLHDVFVDNLNAICQKKGMILPLLCIANFDADLSERIFSLLSPMLEKTLLKPSKAGQHFENHYEGFCRLLETQLKDTYGESYFNKPHKADTTEVFLPAIWTSIVLRYLSNKKVNCDKPINNALLTFVHYIINMVKVFQKKNTDNVSENQICMTKLEQVCELFMKIIKALPRYISLETTRTNETFKLFCKLCLKHGVGSTQIYVLKQLTELLKRMQCSLEQTTELLELLFSHSEFMNVALDVPSEGKFAVFDLMYVLCKAQSGIKERKHVPLLLSAYSATMHSSDRKIRSLLALYEKESEQTMFYDFKPFLWGMAAGNFYSARPDSRKSLWRQPRTGDILDILEMSMIENTILNFPLKASLGDEQTDTILDDEQSTKVYDVGFLLSVFSQLLSPDYNLIMHKFTRSGAMAIVVAALASLNRDVRAAACHVLAKFFYQLEMKGQFGKDRLLWLRFVEVTGKAVGAVETHKLNSFAALFMARTALVLTNPTDPMYAPLSNFIGVTCAPNLARIPELYTFLNSSAVDHQIHRQFILEILRGGMRTQEDGVVADEAMTFKLIMELFSSAISDGPSTILILEIIERAVMLPKTARSLCLKQGLATWLHNVLQHQSDPMVLNKVNCIYQNIIKYPGLEGTMELVKMISH